MFFNKQKTENYVIFSPMEGVLLKNGKPLANTKIIRTLKWNGNDEGLVEEFSTDEKGYFSLPLHEEELSLNILIQFVAYASIETEMEGKMFDIWYNSKLHPELYSETGAPMEGLICDLVNDEIPVFIGNSSVTNILTKCRWDNMPEQ